MPGSVRNLGERAVIMTSCFLVYIGEVRYAVRLVLVASRSFVLGLLRNN